ncbi:MAG TPA: bifunctional DNA-formamidopyrimidine glycosylase/DNA-(apurinic or apyrimidinic site) lyase [Stellaceae bacterium]|nr:bifunctional DNA-formamidopyrimidine glycosylase/DNA-(apurinic or apyrimidinic site) lyase [Stellaceae bacterium]
MPELPEVETVVRGLAHALTGKRLARLDLARPDLRSTIPPGLAAQIAGKRIERIARRAKYILIHLEDGGVVIVHLGMSGRLIIVPPGAATPRAKHDHAVFYIDDGSELRFNDARRFGLLDYAEEAQLAVHPRFRHLGPEPLSNAFNGPMLAASLHGKQTSIKAALLDQRVVAGIGNIYACEALYGAGLSPRRLARAVQGDRAERLATAIHDVLTRAIAAGGSSLRDYVQTSGELGYFQHHWAVYGKEGEPCPGCDCGSSIKRIVQGARSTFYCAKRQK